MTTIVPIPAAESKLKGVIVVGEVPHCLVTECGGWYVDSFSSKYWIKCKDQRHRNQEVDKNVVGVVTTHTQNQDNKANTSRPPLIVKGEDLGYD